MFSKKVLKKLIDKYKISYADISMQLNDVGVDSDNQYRLTKALSDDYKLKVSVLESVLKDIDKGFVDSNISIDDIKVLSDDLNINCVDTYIDVSDTNKDKIDCGTNDSVTNCDNIDNSSLLKDINSVKNDTIIIEKDSNSVGKDIEDEKSDNNVLNFDMPTSKNDTDDGLVCTFKGYGYKDLYGYDKTNPKYALLVERVERLLIRLIEEKGVTTFITGGSLGFDIMVYFIIDRLKDNYPHIKNNLAIPFLQQDSKWTGSNREDYRYMKANADSLVYVDEIDDYNITDAPKGEFHSNKLRVCHEYMIDNSDVLVALYRGESGGAVKYCIDYADKQQLKGVVKINPDLKV